MSDVLGLAVDPRRPRNNRGCFIGTRCPHDDCDGELRHEGGGFFRCDGLRAPDDGSPMYACPRGFYDGDLAP